MADEFNFEEFDKNFDGMAIVYEEMTKVIVPMFLAYRKAGLSVQESAALTAAMIAHTMPVVPQKPEEE